MLVVVHTVTRTDIFLVAVAVKNGSCVTLFKLIELRVTVQKQFLTLEEFGQTSGSSSMNQST